MGKKSIALILGTRPEIIKMCPVIRLLQKRKHPFFLIHTGQHYSYNMDRQFFEQLELPEPRYRFTRLARHGANRHDALVRHIRIQCEGVLAKERPSTVLVQGDTDTVVAGAMAAKNVGGILIGHVEAGLRSYDLQMPEERNRIKADRLSDWLFAPTRSARNNLMKEKFDKKRIHVTGNTIVDALFQNVRLAQKTLGPNKRRKAYALVTLHRPETVDNVKRLRQVAEALRILANQYGLDIVFPAHPRTRGRLQEFGIDFPADAPMGFLDFIWHEKNAKIILTDSGGVQEEACILKTPCVTIRTTTERPETVDVGANRVSGYEIKNILKCAEIMMRRRRSWGNPFGDGKASGRILDLVNKTVL